MRKVFFSFAWEDIWQVNQVRNSWVTKGSYQNAGFLDKAEIEKLKLQTNKAIKAWIDKQIHGTSVTCVLIGENTSNSEWVKYEIEQSRKQNKGIVAIYIHNAKNSNGGVGKVGENPLSVYKKTLKQKIGKAVLSGGIGLVLARIFPITAPFAWGLSGVAIAQLLKGADYYKTYDWNEEDGRNNLGDWIEAAAQQAER
ncbi:hypothetical protein [uncultured Gammaproteobacteria bacterium]|jgi:hypothetical protein|nr:hypothetical protein [uncultured Gammaproteobacteria bacterium]CAC9968174.1 hypothetical protein [uncultured Gammaproteobacteria bacterium]CAC9994224.1 hypothetical protein [uncultured Gammaproteobacteria bacterium]